MKRKLYFIAGLFMALLGLGEIVPGFVFELVCPQSKEWDFPWGEAEY